LGISTWPEFDSEQINAVTNVLQSGKVNSWAGEETKLFQKEFASWCGTSYAIALSNGSVALSLAYEAIGLGSGDEVITTPRTYVATSSCAALLGAKPIFADVCPKSGLITAETIKPLINSKTKAISVVHLAGWPAKMNEILELAKSFNLYVVEDCSQAHGATIKQNGIRKSVGSFGDVATWSFCQDKIISTGGEGGMITTSSEVIMDRVWSLKDHGKTLESVFRKKHAPGYRFLHERLGSNFRITELQSAIGRIQLKKLSRWSSLRNKNAQILLQKLENLSIINIPLPDSDIEHAWYKFYAYINVEFLSEEWDRNKIINQINELGFPAFHGGCTEIYKEKCFNYNQKKILPNAEYLGQHSLMFLVDHTISSKDMENYAETIKSILLKASI